MRKRNGLIGRALVASGLLVAAAAAAPSQAPPSAAALGKLQPGLWELRDLDKPQASLAPLCLGDPKALAQIRHRSRPCSGRVVSQDDASATLHYTCSSGGYGQTLIRVETPRLAQIDTQGIVDSTPFAARIEARRVGACGTHLNFRR